MERGRCIKGRKVKLGDSENDEALNYLAISIYPNLNEFVMVTNGT